ncbi:unnamed protein product [Chondrus crispus]|uniref:Uncharacterized protein n=1 Tax=Chondrus crispus TaxID=2769 RepID=R7Q448_CHOCR|nr:unnamed protein product [Chondrus crispus]CDF33302.1 unnamed protein product [Chondrus crispus]|eukprot:XP_005713105.1 unnamed protein product [Chondrus crispus]
MPIFFLETFPRIQLRTFSPCFPTNTISPRIASSPVSNISSNNAPTRNLSTGL